MKNKKGFTLIELLVVIIIMLTILIIAIVSVNNISDKNKEKAWDKVKNEVELAAKDYYETNSYKLTLKGDSDLYAKISVGALVENDFLNIVTNPKTGKKINKCDYVEVKIENNITSYLYKESTSDDACGVQEIIKITDIGAPSVKVELVDDELLSKNPDGNNGYYKTDVNVLVDVKTANNGPISEVKYKFNDGEFINIDGISSEDSRYSVPAIDGKDTIVTFVVTNIYGKTTSDSIVYWKDTKDPACGEATGVSNTWTKNNRTITQRCIDDISGCVKEVDSKTFNKTTRTHVFQLEDNAGNTNSCTVDVKVDKTIPICGSNNGSTTWTNQNRTITQNCTDNESGCVSVSKTYTESLKEDKITIIDGVGNTNTCDVNVYVDKVKPKCSIAFSGTAGLNGWFITDNVSVNLTKSDVKSENGVSSGISKYGLSTSSSALYNEKSSASQTSRTKGTKWYGYVEDKAGNVEDCSKTVKLEKNVTIEFDVTKTNNTKSVNSGKKSHGEKVFDSSEGACGYGTCSDIKCHTDKNKTKQCSKDYFARACMYVRTYARYFKVSSAYTGTDTSVSVVDLNDKNYDNASTPGMKRITSVNRYSCQDDWSSKYYYNSCGNPDGTGRNDFSAHVYQYITESGLGSNKIRLYTEYDTDCGY